MFANFTDCCTHICKQECQALTAGNSAIDILYISIMHICMWFI